jgi:type II secretory pathway predicted ATPase ExeA
VYEAHFGLADLPFHIAPDPRFYVDAAPHRAALDALLHGLAQGDEFMLLTGDFGSGKTTVARRLVELVDRDEYAVGELSGLRTEGDGLLNRIAESLGERNFDADHRLGALMGLLERVGRDGRQALLMIDEAHGVGLDALRRLKKLTAIRVEGHGVLHVCFVGRAAPPGLEDLERLGRPLVIGTTVHLGLLDAAGTRAYIVQRLDKVGWTGRPAFDEDATDEIHRLCDGNPGRINRLCAHILLQLYINGRDDTSPAVVRAVDDLMKSELEGEGLPIDLPPPAAADREPDTVLEPRSRLEDEVVDRIEIEGLSTSPFAQTLPAVLPATPLMVSRPWTGARSSGSSAGQRVMRVAFAVLLMVGGGVIWQAIGGRATVDPDAARQIATGVTAVAPAPPGPPASTAAGLAAVAEQAIAQQPPGAGQPAGVAAAAPEAAHAAPPSATQPQPRRVADTAREATAVDRGRRRGRARGAETDPAAGPAADAATPPATEPAPVTEPAPASVRARGPAEAAAAATPVVCSAAAETMGLCTRAAVREQPRSAPARAAPPPAETTTPAQAAAQPAPQAAPPPSPAPAPATRPRPACDTTRTALGLCPD